MSVQSLFCNKNIKYFLLSLMLIFLISLFLKIAFKIEIKKSDMYPNGLCISTTKTKPLSEQELKLYIITLGNLIAEKGDIQALNALTLLADKGNHDAQAELGMLYQSGMEGKKDWAKAFALYSASVNSSSLAQINLGHFYEYGVYVKQDYKKAYELYKKASEEAKDLNHKKLAQYNLANLYRQGLGIEEDIHAAISLYKKVIETDELLKPLPLSVENVKTYSLVALGHLYGKKQQYDIAIQYYMEASERGNLHATGKLGYSYLIGTGVQKDISKGIKLCSYAAERDEPVAQYNLGVCYLEGLGLKKNIAKAKELFESSAKQGYEPAKQILEFSKRDK